MRASAGWTAFHLHAWKPLLESLYAHERPYFVARSEAGSIVRLLPLVRVRSRVFGHYLVSMPFVNYGGPLGSLEAVIALTDRAIALADAGKVRLLELLSRTALPIALTASHRKITVVLDLPTDVELLRKHIRSKLRCQIKRPEKKGVVIRFGPDQVAPFFDVFSQHMRDLGTRAPSDAFLHEIADRFGESRRQWSASAAAGAPPVVLVTTSERLTSRPEIVVSCSASIPREESSAVTTMRRHGMPKRPRARPSGMKRRVFRTTSTASKSP